MTFKSSGLELYLKKMPTQVFSCEICESIKNTYFEEHLRTIASGKSYLQISTLHWAII